MKRFTVMLRDGGSVTIRGDRLDLSDRGHPFDGGHPCIRDANGDLVFVGSSPGVAYVADADFEEMPTAESAEAAASEEGVGPVRWLNLLGKAASVLSALAMVVFVILLATGHSTIGAVHTDRLLTLFAFTLIGGIVSIGGVELFSLRLNLRRAKDRLETVERRVSRGDISTKLVASSRFSFTTQDGNLLDALSNAQWARGDRHNEYFDTCARSRLFQLDVREEARRWVREAGGGWALAEIAPIDTINGGILVDLTFERSSYE